MNQYQQKALLFLVGIITMVVSWFTQGIVEKAIFFNFAIISFVLSALLLAFDHYCWKFKWFYGWLVQVPNLNGLRVNIAIIYRHLNPGIESTHGR